MVIFRDARRDEVPQIVALLADDPISASREAPLGDAYWAAFDDVAADPRNRLIVAELDGQVAGVLQLTLIPGLTRNGMLRGQIEGVRVADGHRGRGLGRALIAWAMDEARRAGFSAMQYNFVVSSNAGAVRLWQRHGFRIVGQVPGAFRHRTLGPTDIYVMHRYL